MENVTLDWSVMPAMVYLPLDKFKGSYGFYYPFLGPGVYLFVYPSKEDYQIYYVGHSQEIGCRLAEHIQSYMSIGSGYHIPTSIDYYNENVYKYLNMPFYDQYISNKPEDFPDNTYKSIGEMVMKNTYFGFAKLYQSTEAYRREIEYVLQRSILSHNKLDSYGWFGEKEATQPTKDIEVINYYNNDKVRNIIGTTLPNRCTFKVDE